MASRTMMQRGLAGLLLLTLIALTTACGGADARKDMEKLFDAKVMLRLWVKVKSGWSDDERALRSLGYSDLE